MTNENPNIENESLRIDEALNAILEEIEQASRDRALVSLNDAALIISPSNPDIGKQARACIAKYIPQVIDCSEKSDIAIERPVDDTSETLNDISANSECAQDETETAFERTFAKAMERIDVERWRSVAYLTGTSDIYFYSKNEMTGGYAHLLLLEREADDVSIFIDRVREESRLYPRPMRATSLTFEPLNLSLDRVYEIFEQLQLANACTDIKKTVASNGDVYYYSTDHITDAFAERYAERHSVERLDRL